MGVEPSVEDEDEDASGRGPPSRDRETLIFVSFVLRMSTVVRRGGAD